MDVRAALAAAEIFSAAAPSRLDEIAGLSAPRRLRRGQLLFSEGDPSDHLFVVADGRIKVLVSSPRGEELILTVLGPGDALGELSVLDGQPRSATAQALEDVQLVAVQAAPLCRLLEQAPELSVAWAREMSVTVRRLTGSSADLVFLDLPRRLAKLLIEGQGDAVDLGMSQADTASRMGVTRQSLNRALSALQRRGWVHVDGHRVSLQDRDALRRFAGS